MPREPMDRPMLDHDGPDHDRSTEKETHERENEQEPTDREMTQDGSRERWLGGQKYEADFKRMRDDLNDWMRQNGFEKGTGLRSEDRSIFGTKQTDPWTLRDRSTGATRPGRELRLMDPWVDMSFSAMERGFVVTGSNEKKGHNKGSAHYKGNAIDVRTRGKTNEEIEALIRDARASGYKVKDERTHPPGQKVWSGPHIHIETPRKREVRTQNAQPERKKSNRENRDSVGPRSNTTRDYMPNIRKMILP